MLRKIGVRAAVPSSLWKKSFQSFCWKGCFSKAAAWCLMMYSRHSLLAWPITLLHLLLSAHFTWVDRDKSNKALCSGILQKARRCFPCLLSCTTAEPSSRLYTVFAQSIRYYLSVYLPFLPPCCNFSLQLSDCCMRSASLLLGILIRCLRSFFHYESQRMVLISH